MVTSWGVDCGSGRAEFARGGNEAVDNGTTANVLHGVLHLAFRPKPLESDVLDGFRIHFRNAGAHPDLAGLRDLEQIHDLGLEGGGDLHRALRGEFVVHLAIEYQRIANGPHGDVRVSNHLTNGQRRGVVDHFDARQLASASRRS